jgi:hypothetical protein
MMTVGGLEAPAGSEHRGLIGDQWRCMGAPGKGNGNDEPPISIQYLCIDDVQGTSSAGANA